MIFAIRADAGVVQGTGHVMRCLSLAEKLLERGHQVHLLTNESGIAWLESAIEASGVRVSRVEADSIELDSIKAYNPDWLIVDSYQIPASAISEVNQAIPVLAIVDSDSRGIEATLYLDTNLFAEKLDWSGDVAKRLLAGSKYSLIRNQVMTQARSEPWKISNRPVNLLVFLGGSDPYDYSPLVAKALAGLELDFKATFIAPERLHETVKLALGAASAKVNLIGPTPTLASFYGNADVVISAAGTSSWDVCTLGIPSLLLAVVDNQQFSLAQIAENGLTLTNNLTDGRPGKIAALTDQIASLVTDYSLREQLSKKARSYFDGKGRDRVVDRLEQGAV